MGVDAANVRDLSAQFEESVDEMVEHGWDEQVARKALLMQWEKDIDQNGGGRQTYKNVERIVKVRDYAEFFLYGVYLDASLESSVFHLNLWPTSLTCGVRRRCQASVNASPFIV